MSRSLDELSEFLVGHWELKNNFKDSSPFENHGTPTDITWKPSDRGMKPSMHGGEIEMPSVSIGDNSLVIAGYYKWEGDNASYAITMGSSSGVNGFRVGVTDTGNLRALIGFASDFEEQNLSIDYAVPLNEFTHLAITFDIDTSVLTGYINGVKQLSKTLSLSGDSGIFTSDSLLFAHTLSPNATYDDTRIYVGTTFADTEVLDLYNSTKETYGVTYAERSYTHKLSPEITDDTVFATNMSTKNADGTLVDLSGHSNHGTVDGCVRSGGYFRDGMRFDGTDDTVTSPNVSFSGEYTLEAFARIDETVSTYGKLIEVGTSDDRLSFMIRNDNKTMSLFTKKDAVTFVNIRSPSSVIGATHYFVAKVSDSLCELYIDGVAVGEQIGDYRQEINGELVLCNSIVTDGEVNCNYIFSSITCSTFDVKQRFNSIADLCLYSCDFSEMSSNTTVYTDALPYSSAIIKSGSFKLDNGIVCVTDGQLTLRCAHDFDGSEEINFRSTPDNIRLAYGTGSVSYGDIDASISQGSSLITLDMLAGDTLDKLDIQFREHLGC